MANIINCGLEVNEFESKTGYYVFVRIKTLGRDMDPHNPPAMC